ncbi:hypothetical protein TrST_g3864 [Triparma strigata]|uniref:Protein kinase domain-containing protein n=1 Tax=Triparma strigata TaxID=1606541 RepID=A0A9W6ZHS9_9STRA|nr:hypothetical protein TrST_g3864 [Triparma strigata]
MASLLNAFNNPKDEGAAGSSGNPPSPTPDKIADTNSEILWPLLPDEYTLTKIIGKGAFATVYAATAKTTEERTPVPDASSTGQYYPHCSIKILELENVGSSLTDILNEVRIMRSISHRNVLDAYATFVRGSQLWLVTQIMAKGSCLNALGVLQERGIQGFDEKSIQYVMNSTLRGLQYLHSQGHIHRDVKAGNILLGSLGGVRLADFGVSGWLKSSQGESRDCAKTFVGTPCWMAPEVMEQISGYDYGADVWSLGITCLELAKGYAPYANFPPMKVLLMTIQEDPPSFNTYEDLGGKGEKHSKEIKSFVNKCLQKDPSKRQSVDELLSHKIFSHLSDEKGINKAREEFRNDILKHIDDIGNTDPDKVVKERAAGTKPIVFESTPGDEDRPAGTTWVFSDGTSQVVKQGGGGGGDDDEDFFDKFEKSTGGENFDKDRGNEPEKVKDEKEPEKDPEKVKDEKDDNLDFMDEFEKIGTE